MPPPSSIRDEDGIVHRVAFLSDTPRYAATYCAVQVRRRKGGRPPLTNHTVTCLECIAAVPTEMVSIQPGGALTAATIATAARICRGK